MFYIVSIVYELTNIFENFCKKGSFGKIMICKVRKRQNFGTILVYYYHFYVPFLKKNDLIHLHSYFIQTTN